MSRGEGSDYFLGLARRNQQLGDPQAALTCLRLALERAQSQCECAAVADAAEALQPALGEQATQLRVEARRREEEASPQPSNASPSAPPRRSGGTTASVDAVRQLLSSPELEGQLRQALSGAQRAEAEVGAAALPVTGVLERILAAGLDVNVTASLALELAIDATGAQDGWLLVADEDDPFPARPGSLPPEASRGILTQVAASRESVLVSDARRDPRFAKLESVQDLAIAAVLCVPLLSPAGALAGVVLLHAEPGRFGPAELEAVEDLARLLAQPLLNAARFQEQGRALARARRREITEEGGVGESPVWLDLLRLLERLAPSDEPVLLVGESGSGKEVVARRLHALSHRRAGPFVAENMGALAEELLESELFGHARGAFTGAHTARPGLFQLAEGGTLFLDEVGEMSLAAQQRLLRVLQERELRPVGGTETIQVDARILAATNKDLGELVAQGRFREDLYFRLNVLRLRVPALRERPGDVKLLLERFLARAAAAHGRTPPEIQPPLLARLEAYPWPGNVRELQAYATRLVLEGPTAELNGVGHHASQDDKLGLEIRLPGPEILGLREARVRFERSYIELVLERCGGRVTEAAELLGMNRTYFSSLLKRLGLR